MIERFRWLAALALIAMIVMLTAACGNNAANTNANLNRNAVNETGAGDVDAGQAGSSDDESDGRGSDQSGEHAQSEPEQQEEQLPGAVQEAIQQGEGEDAVLVVANPDSITVLINKQFAHPKDYVPEDLVEVNVEFTFKEKNNPRRKMRKEAAEALERMFAGAQEDGVGLLGVSGYRPYSLQKLLFDNYVKKDGLEAANRYSARPGHSEHSTGLAMDVTGSDGKCAVSDCFAGTEAALWLADHAHEYGFIIRYPEGKEDITGYKYEPWHLRYVGTELAALLYENGLTLEEYYGAPAEPVSGVAASADAAPDSEVPDVSDATDAVDGGADSADLADSAVAADMPEEAAIDRAIDLADPGEEDSLADGGDASNDSDAAESDDSLF